MPLIRGRAVDAAGRGVAGARVMLAGGPVPAPDIAMLTAADGAFAIAVPAPGRWRLLVATDAATAEVQVDVGDAEAVVQVTLPVTPG